MKKRRNSRNAWGHVADPAAWFGTEIGFLGLLTAAAPKDLQPQMTTEIQMHMHMHHADADARLVTISIHSSAYTFQNLTFNFKATSILPPTYPTPCYLSLCFLAAWPASLTSAAQTLKDEPVTSRITEGAIPL